MEDNTGDLLEKINNESFKLFSKSTIHGISKVIKSRNLPKKLVWACLVIVSYTYCAYSVMQNTIDYLKYPVIKKYGQVYENEPNFPAVTFCNFNESNHICIFNDRNCSKIHIRVKNKKCYTFNGGRSKLMDSIDILRSKQAGFTFGLKLGLSRKDANKDITIYIHNQSRYLNLKKEITISHGMQKDIAVDRIFQTYLNAPYSKCKKEVIIGYEEYDKIKHPYFQSECFMTCKLRKIADSCNKTIEFEENIQYYYTNDNYFWEFYNNMEKNCSLKNESLVRYVNDKFLSEGENIVCEKSCPIECESVSYITSVNSILLNTNTVRSEFHNVLDNFSFINIYYEDFGYKSISEIPKTSFEDLLGTIGGLIGMFLGTSLLSFIEIPDILLQITLKSIDHARKTTQQKPIAINHGTPEITNYFNRQNV